MKKKLTKRQFKRQQQESVDHKQHRDNQQVVVKPKPMKKPPPLPTSKVEEVDDKIRPYSTCSPKATVVNQQQLPSPPTAKATPAKVVVEEEEDEEEEIVSSDEEFARRLDYYCKTSDNEEGPSSSPFTNSKRRRFPQKRGSKKNKRYKRPTVFHAGNRCVKSFSNDKNNNQVDSSSGVVVHDGSNKVNGGGSITVVNGH